MPAAAQQATPAPTRNAPYARRPPEPLPARCASGETPHQTVDAHAHATGGRHAILQGSQEIFIKCHLISLFLGIRLRARRGANAGAVGGGGGGRRRCLRLHSGVVRRHLRLQALPLVHRVSQLAAAGQGAGWEAGSRLAATDVRKAREGAGNMAWGLARSGMENRPCRPSAAPFPPPGHPCLPQPPPRT